MEDVREECTMQNIVTEIETMFCDEEYGFEVYALIKGDEKTLKRFAFYEKSKNNQDNFKDKIQKTIAEVVKRDYGVEASQYVKGIYHLNLSLALKYLELADLHFQMPSEHRRHLDCQCEIQYVKFLLGTGSIEQLQLSQEALFENQYWIQYYKCHLKLSVCYILMGKREEALQHLLEAEAPAIMKNDERIKYLCFHPDCALVYCMQTASVVSIDYSGQIFLIFPNVVDRNLLLNPLHLSVYNLLLQCMVPRFYFFSHYISE